MNTYPLCLATTSTSTAGVWLNESVISKSNFSSYTLLISQTAHDFQGPTLQAYPFFDSVPQVLQMASAMKVYIDLRTENITTPTGWSNDPDDFKNIRHLDIYTPGSIPHNISKLVGCNDTKVFLKGVGKSNSNHYILRGIDFYQPSKCHFFLATSEKVADIYYVHVDATMAEFVEILGRGDKLALECLTEWLDRVDVELFATFPRRLRDGLNFWGK